VQLGTALAGSPRWNKIEPRAAQRCDDNPAVGSAATSDSVKIVDPQRTPPFSYGAAREVGWSAGGAEGVGGVLRRSPLLPKIPHEDHATLTLFLLM